VDDRNFPYLPYVEDPRPTGGSIARGYIHSVDPEIYNDAIQESAFDLRLNSRVRHVADHLGAKRRGFSRWIRC